MKKILFLLSIPLLFAGACVKKQAKFTKVGFYFEDAHVTGDMSYDLYIDDQYEGKINILPQQPTDTALLLFRVLDNERHTIDIKQGNTLLTAAYLQLTKNSCASGTNRDKAMDVSGTNGWRYVQDNNKGYAVYAAFK